MNTDELKKELDRFNREQENIFNLHREIERLRAENVGLLRENMDLRACLYAHAQHPGFPQARVTNPDELNGTCPTCGTIFGDGDPDEPVAGTA